MATVINGRRRYGPDTDDPDTCAHCKNTGTWKGVTKVYYCECPVGQDLERGELGEPDGYMHEREERFLNGQ